ncbi:uncharacterized protein LOC124914675 [Impatiens glandulifera]|uniref:uncharacterized protein LOC124914675 n=1 Tax=Impatiens glandulifera TaxID=253017 RepID=UPI001FB14A68|nr:uncharacterized protein LOC124914675 [Impatiens glandulifera]
MANYTIDTIIAEEPTVDIQVNQETINTPLLENPKQIELEEEDRHDNGKGKHGNMITQKSEGKVLSRYLRASTGSCHDMCKHGQKHSFNEESKIPLSTIIRKRMAEIREEKKKADIIKEQKRMSLPNLENNKGIITQSSNGLAGNRRYSEIVAPIKTGIPRASSTICRPPTVRRKSDINLQKEKPAPPLPPIYRNLPNLKRQYNPIKAGIKRQDVDNSIPEMESIIDEEVPEKTLYVIETNPNGNDLNNISIESTPPNEETIVECGVDTPLIIHQSLSPSSKSKILKNKRMGKKPAPLPSPPPPPLSFSASSVISIKSDIPKLGTLRTRKSKDVGVTTGSRSESPKKLNIRRGKTVDLPSENTSPFRTRKPKEGGVSSVKRTDSPRKLNLRRGKTVDLPSETTSPFKTRKPKEGGVSSAKRSESPRKLNFRRGKIVDLPTESNSPRRLKFKLTRVPSSETRLGKNDEKKPISQKPESVKTMKSVESSHHQNTSGGGKVRARIFQSSGATVKDDISKKVNFRRGKVIDLKPISTTPKKLNFKLARVGVEIQSGKINSMKRSGSRKEGVEKTSNGSSSNPGKVVLRHRGIEEGSNRRESQSSVNNVIEETANKLVQTRKSKVKALVGAFETIISLKDKY